MPLVPDIERMLPNITPPRLDKAVEAKDVASITSLRNAVRKIWEAIYKQEGRTGPVTILDSTTIEGDLIIEEGDIIIEGDTLEQFITNIINQGTSLSPGSWKASPQTVGANGEVVWDVEVTNDLDFYEFDGTNTILTFKQAGFYHISGILPAQDDSGGSKTLTAEAPGQSQLILDINAAGVPDTIFPSSWSFIWEMAENDTLEFTVSSGGSIQINDGGALAVMRVAGV